MPPGQDSRTGLPPAVGSGENRIDCPPRRHRKRSGRGRLTEALTGYLRSLGAEEIICAGIYRPGHLRILERSHVTGAAAYGQLARHLLTSDFGQGGSGE